MDLKEKKYFVENSLVFIGTSTKEGLPNITVVDRPILLDDGKVLVADVMMSSCKYNLLSNPNCSVVFFDFKESVGLKVFGTASYFRSGTEFEKVQGKLKGTDYKAKGAFAITAEKVIEVR